jgi:hypothetical protein
MAKFVTVRGPSNDFLRIFTYDVPEAWTPVDFAPTWGNGSLGANWAPVAFTKDPMGFVHIRGMAFRSSGAAATIFTLPLLYRPKLYLSFATVGDGTVATINIQSTGVVELGVGAATVYLNINAIFDTR